MLVTTNIFGLDFICAISYEQLANEIIGDVEANAAGITSLVTPNANGINLYATHPVVHAFYRQAKYILPDGQPLVWLSKFTKQPIKQRLTGSDFFPVLFNKLREPQHKCLFVVSSEHIKTEFTKQKPEAAYLVPEFFDADDDAAIERISRWMSDEIIHRQTNYVLTGISDPKQILLARRVSEILKSRNHGQSCVFFLLGASFEFYFGLKKRAPAFFQKYGLEWFYRLVSDPKRMFRRYVIGNFMFILRSLKWIITKRRYQH